MNPVKKIKALEKGKHLPVPLDLDDSEHRRMAMTHYNWFDHAILRRRWTNFFEIAPGVYRSNQPTHERFETYAAMGIKAVLNLRGEGVQPRYLFEKETCDSLGIKMVNISLHARKAPPKENLLQVIEAMRTIDRPFLMHCKSGADRAGLASAVYLMVYEGVPVSEAKKMLSVKFIHLKWSKTGILDYFLEVYEARLRKGDIAFLDWLRDEYDEEVLTAGFHNGRKLPQ